MFLFLIGKKNGLLMDFKMKIYTDFEAFMKSYGFANVGSLIYKESFDKNGFIIVHDDISRSRILRWCSGHPLSCTNGCGENRYKKCKLDYNKMFRVRKLERIIND